jgi:hypothetical protein
MESNIFRRFKQDSRQGRGDAILMSVGYGLGMLAMGFVAIAIFGVIFYMITNREENNDD